MNELENGDEGNMAAEVADYNLTRPPPSTSAPPSSTSLMQKPVPVTPPVALSIILSQHSFFLSERLVQKTKAEKKRCSFFSFRFSFLTLGCQKSS